jgi:hypothetical protein
MFDYVATGVKGCFFFALVGLVVFILVAALTPTPMTAPPVPMTGQRRIDRNCRVAHLLWDDKPIAELTRIQIQELDLCQALGE